MKCPYNNVICCVLVQRKREREREKEEKETPTEREREKAKKNECASKWMRWY